MGRNASATSTPPAAIPTWSADRDGLRRHDRREAGQQLADAVRGHRTLHGAVVHGARPAPGYALDGARAGDRLDGPNEGHEHEGGKQLHERRTDVQPHTRPGALWQADPRSPGNPVEVVETQRPANYRTRNDPGKRRPQAQPRSRLEGDAPDDQNRGYRGERRTQRRLLRRIGQAAEYDRQHGRRHQHVHGADDGRRQKAPEQGEPQRNHDRDERGGDDQGGEQRRTAVVEGADRDPDKGSGGTHEEQVSRSDPAQPNCLQSRADTADGDRAEHGPGQVGVGSAAGPDDDCGNEDDAGDAEHHQLQAATQRQNSRGILVGLVANACSALLVTVAHEVPSAGSRTPS